MLRATVCKILLQHYRHEADLQAFAIVGPVWDGKQTSRVWPLEVSVVPILLKKSVPPTDANF